MFKKYQIKWLLIMSACIILGTASLGEVASENIRWWHLVNHAAKVFIPLGACWLVHGYFLTNNFKKTSGYPKHLLSILTGFAVLLLLSFALDFILPKNYLFSREVGYERLEDIKAHLWSNAFLSVLCFIVFYNRHTSVALKKSRLEKDLLEKAHLRAQLISLQQQISPHFLFNSLSTLKTMVSDDIAKDYIVELAGVYRYVLSFNEKYLAPVEDEVKFIRSYLHILGERFQNALSVEIDISPEYHKFIMPSLSLQLLIENAIKHNISSAEHPLLILVCTTENGCLKVENNLQPKKSRSGQSGTGLKNIVERYRLLSDKSVVISRTEDKFSVTIPLLVYEDHNYRR